MSSSQTNFLLKIYSCPHQKKKKKKEITKSCHFSLARKVWKSDSSLQDFEKETRKFLVKN